MSEQTAPREIDYTAMPIGQRTRLPRGIIIECPRCKKHGVAVIYAWRRGRYAVSVWHVGAKDHAGHPPIVVDACAFNALNAGKEFSNHEYKCLQAVASEMIR